MTDNDARLRDLMRSSAPVPPTEDVDWTALHARVMKEARPFARHTTAAWWQTLARWSPRGIPAAAAAAVAGFIMLGTVLRPDSRTPDFVVIEEELAAGMNGALPLLVAGADDDMLDALLFFDGDEP